jgi:hypothetical protein
LKRNVSAPTVAQGFAELYGANGESACIVQPALEFDASITPTFAVIAAWELMNWPRADMIDPDSAEWKLGAEAAREIQSLEIHGEVSQRLASETTPEGLAERWRAAGHAASRSEEFQSVSSWWQG